MASKFRDYYDILKVPKTASDEEIKLAYRRLARQHHPDLHPEKDKAEHTARMQEINEAYAVLGAKEHRQKYDQYGEHWKEGPPPATGGQPDAEPFSRSADPEAAGFSDFFRDLFGGARGSGGVDERFGSDLDLEATLELSLEESVRGVEKSFSLMTEGLCPQCRGTGHIKDNLCPVCGGIGEVRRTREVKTRIPPGLTDGARIRLKGQGNEGPRGRGDLYLTLHLKPDARFRIQGTHLEIDAKIMPWQAALGAEVTIQTLDGPVRVRIAKGTHAGARLRLAGKGLGKAGARGDLFIRLQIDIPEKMSAQTEALFKQMEAENHGAL